MTILLFLTYGICCGQVNLVPNPGFETLSVGGCDSMEVVWGNAPPWDSPAGTPDIFNTCSTFWGVNVPSNLFGYQYPHSGNGYVGEEFYELNDDTFREYIQVKLDSTLVFQHKYCITFYVSLAEFFSLASNNIGVYFSNTHILPSGSNRLNFTPQILDTNIISDTVGWTLISGEFTAIGGEQYIIIGNFNTAATTNYLHVGTHNSTSDSINSYYNSYYYIDDVSLVDCTGSGLGMNEKTNKETINIYPNPVSDELNVQINNHEPTEIILYDLSSRKLLQQTFTNTTIINTEQLTKGMYLYTVRNRNGIIKNGKVIKQ